MAVWHVVGPTADVPPATRHWGGHNMHRLRSSIVPVVAPLMLSMPLTGCSLVAQMTGGFEDPTLRLQGSKVESVSPDVTRLLFTIAVHNPNAFPLRSQVQRYRLTIDKTVVAEGTSSILATVPAGAPTLVDLPIEVGPGSLSNAAPRAVVLGEIPYDLDVWLSIGAWLHPREVHLAASSVLRLNLPLGLVRGDAFAFPIEGWQS
jgi:LEA14-like dessication related protein